MANKITAQEAFDIVQQNQQIGIDSQQSKVLPYIYEQIRTAISKENPVYEIALDGIQEVYPKADIQKARTVLVANGFTVNGTVISWAQ